MTVLLGQFVRVRKHPIATIDIAPGEWLWSPLNEVCSNLGFVSQRSVKPIVHEIAQSYPGLFLLTNVLVGRSHRAEMIRSFIQVMGS
jgi:hypothetical protein